MTVYMALVTFRRQFLRHFWGMSIGVGSRVARSAKIDTTNPKGIIIGDWTAISFDVAVISHDFINRKHLQTRIGSYCMIGARSMILPGVTIGDHCIVAAGSIVSADVPPNCAVMGNPARVIERGIVTSKWGIRDPSFLAAKGDADQEARIHKDRVASLATGLDRRETTSLKALASLPHGLKDKSLSDLGFDSFALVSLRAEIEVERGIEISDAEWSTVVTPADILSFADRHTAVAQPRLEKPRPMTRSYEIGMPQMAVGGLSEGWLLKELGDFHWHALTSALGVPSSEITDAEGDRLYATFTCIKLALSDPLLAFRENGRLEMRLEPARFGGGIFFSDVDIRSGATVGNVKIMSSFSKFGEKGENTSLIRSQPKVPRGFPIPQVAGPPAILAEYKEARAQRLEEAIFATDYRINPYHDINGVGLLYFAAYPTISDTAALEYFGRDSALSFSTIGRNLYYFANSGADDEVRFQIHSVHTEHDTRTIVSSLSRVGDGKLMAIIETKQRSKPDLH